MTERNLDPKYNYTASENAPVGARIPEFVFRNLIEFSLKQIRANVDDPRNNFIDELFRTHGSAVREQIKGYLRDHPNIAVTVNYPRDDLSLPFIACVNAGEAEDTSALLLSDYGGEQVLGDEGGRQTLRQQRTFVDKATVQIFIAAQDPNLALYLSHIVRYVLASNSFRLTERYDIHNMTLGLQDVQYDERFFPMFCYTRLVTVQFQTIFDFNVDEVTNAIVSLDLLVSTTDSAGVELISSVPAPDDV